METPYAIITAKANSLLAFLGGITLVAIALIGLIAFYIARKVADPIIRMQQLASVIAQGDLTQTVAVTSKDEIGRLAEALNSMVSTLKNIIGHVHKNSQQVVEYSSRLSANAEQSALAAQQIAASIMQVAEGADKQTQLVSTTTAVIGQMSGGIEQTAATSQRVSEKSMQAAEKAMAGDKSVKDAMQQMTELERTVHLSAGAVADLDGRSQEIGKIVDTIANIAGQTNLLALNAAIEAARAGEQGRGFAVVADEVRKLAEQSEEAAKQIAVMIGEIQQVTAKAVSAMEQGTGQAAAGTKVIAAAGATFQEITDLTHSLSGQVSEITQAISQLAANSQSMVASAKEIDAVTKSEALEVQTVSAATEEQSASMEEITASCDQMAGIAQDLQQAVERFRIQ